MLKWLNKHGVNVGKESDCFDPNLIFFRGSHPADGDRSADGAEAARADGGQAAGGAPPRRGRDTQVSKLSTVFSYIFNI